MRRLRQLPITPIILGLLFALGVAVGSGYFGAYTETGGRPFFYQRIFAPAVMLACDRGFVSAPPESSPALADFLAVSVDELSCAELPEDLPATELDAFQAISRYLLLAVGLTWSVVGVSWSALAPLYGVLFGLVLMAAYGLFRLGMGKPLALIGASLLAFSPLQLANLPHLRDFAKAPFMLCVLVVMGWLVARATDQRQVLALAAVGGLVTGLGLGFRTDLLIMVPPFLVVLVLLLPAWARDGFRLRLVAVLLFAGSFFLAAWPILTARAEDVSLWHFALLGLTTPFDAPLGVAGSIYELGYEYNDMFIYTTLRSWVDRTGLDLALVDPLSPEYVRASGLYFLEIARSFPADLLVRGYAAILRVLELPFDTPPVPPDSAGAVPPLAALCSLRSAVMPPPWVGLPVALLACLWASTRSPRRAIAGSLGLLYFGATTAIQFQERQVFHWELLSLWALGYLLHRLWRALPALAGKDALRDAARAALTPSRWWRQPVRRGLATAGTLVLVFTVPLFATRTYQQAHLGRLFEDYAQAEREPLSTSEQLGEDGRVLIGAPELFDPPQDTPPGANVIESSYLAVELIPSADCDFVRPIPMTLRYRSDRPRHDFTHTVSLEAGSTGEPSSILLFPAYELRQIDMDVGFRLDPPASSTFAGIELQPEYLNCLLELSEVSDVTRFPLLLPLRLADSWRSRPLYQTIYDPDKPEARRLLTLPADLPVRRRHLETAILPLSADIVFRAGIVEEPGPGQLRVEGQADGGYTYLIAAARPVGPGRVLLAEGTLRSGGFTVGFLRDDAWITSLNVVEPGPFTILARVPAGGADSVIVANCLTGEALRNDFAMSRLGWIE